MGATRVDIQNGSDWDDAPTQAELDEVPAMSHADLIETMKSDEYKRSSKGRALVAESIRRHGITSQPVTNEPATQTGDEIAAKVATARNLFRDPRYKHDAAFRYEVQQKLSNLTAGDNQDSFSGQAITKADFTTPGRCVRVSVSPSASHGVAMTVSKIHKVQHGPVLTGFLAPPKKSTKE